MRKFKKPLLYSLLGLLVLILILIGFNYYGNIPMGVLKEKYTYEDSKFMDIVGMKVHYRVTGTGEPLVLLHGTAASLNTWEGWTKELSKDYQVISLDLPGFGMTGKHFTNDYSYKAYTDFLDVFLDKLGVKTINLAGNSLGGQIAWQYALDHKNRVKKLILINASGYPQDIEAVSTAFRIAKTPGVNNLLLRVTPKSLLESSLKEVYYDDAKVTEEVVTRYHDFQRRRGNRQAFIDKCNFEYKDRSADIPKIEQPTLIIWGKHDPWSPLTMAERFNQEIPDSRLVVFDNAAHIPMEEIPTETAAVVREFLME